VNVAVVGWDAFGVTLLVGLVGWLVGWIRLVGWLVGWLPVER